MKPTVLVLASGRGERFLAAGGTTHKLQALLGDQTVLARTLDAVRASGLPWHLEEASHPGMGDSIAAAVRATASAEGWLILPADLPLVRPETLCLIAAAPDAQTVVRPVHQGRQGHPVRFARTCADALMALGGASGAASVVRRHRLWTVEVDDPGCVTDIDTPEDLAQARELLRARTRR
jgi:molybdenum cofactor cytidylyltransferase